MYITASKLTNVSNVLKFTKAMFWYYYFENKTDDSQPIGSFSSWEENDPIGSSSLSEHSRDWPELE